MKWEVFGFSRKTSNIFVHCQSSDHFAREFLEDQISLEFCILMPQA